MTVVRSQFFKFRSMAVLFNFLLLFAKQIGVKGLNDPITETNKLPFAPKYDLRVCAIQYPPLFIKTQTGNGTLKYDGIMADIFEFISSSLGMTFSFVELNLADVNKFGPVVTAVRAMLRKEFDVFGIGVSLTNVQLDIMKIPIPIIIQDFAFVLPYPEEKSRLVAFIRPYQYDVWLCLLASAILMTPALYFLAKLYGSFSSSSAFITDTEHWNRSMSSHAMYIITVLTSQGDWVPFGQWSFRLGAGVWCLAAIILVNAYSSSLIGYLTVPQLNPIVNSFQELAASSDFKILAEANSAIAKGFTEATDGYRKILGDSLRNDPNSQITNPNDRLKYLKRGPYAYPVISPFFTHHLVYEAYKQAGGKCTHTISNKLDFFMPQAFPFSKFYPFKMSDVDHAFLKLFESGILFHWNERKYKPRVDQCLLEKRTKVGKDGRKSLSLLELSGAFAVLGIGVVLSFFIFVLEYFTSCWRKLPVRKHIRRH